ncbi:WcbI family polysaccharide biosynthesis putative acetyltransferase [Phyllobacterium myrsinacearum]|uniref:Polysaccharide biosynthesis enzyme WcbI domain-containing protein n=1 Tax=Phyllobacterium myrsinacearum TaxID=28101 RepID=A0A839EN51_9HYPH|nr:WcbI family polysaccharide biosynthesis putative acetyltransferase [Phyllobacterium myrsinacearum]MBA8878924.1 hypothetical protein [Phyllobacterium myrsinacearum]
MTVRVAVVGNCTAIGIANAIKVLSPDAFVQHFSVADIHTLEPSRLKSMFEGFDLSLSFAEIGNYASINEQVSKIGRSVLWPSIVFTGYHPDITYFGIEGRVATSCLGAYNSRIVAVAYASELSVEDTAERFNALTFGRLGYFDAYELGRQQFLRTAKQYNLDLEEDFARWEKSDPFMYTINHPKIAVVNDLARNLLEASGLAIKRDVTMDETVHDYFADGIVWPVYPEIAQRIGNNAGSYEFKPAGHAANPSSALHLEEFIDGCFKRYKDDGFTPAQFRTTGLLNVLGAHMGLA